MVVIYFKELSTTLGATNCGYINYSKNILA